jgi:hypothetical protein
VQQTSALVQFKAIMRYRPASDATPSISISIFGLGSAWTTQVVRAG